MRIAGKTSGDNASPAPGVVTSYCFVTVAAAASVSIVKELAKLSVDTVTVTAAVPAEHVEVIAIVRPTLGAVIDKVFAAFVPDTCRRAKPRQPPSEPVMQSGYLVCCEC